MKILLPSFLIEPLKVVRLHGHEFGVVIHTSETWGRIWFLSSSASWAVGLSIQVEAMNVFQSVQQGTHYHADVIYLRLKLE